MIDSPPFEVRLLVSGGEDAEGADQPGACVVTVCGEVDLATAPELDRILSEAIGSDCPEVLVDMAQVEFIDAAGVGVLVAGAKGADAAGSHLQLRAPSAAVKRVLKLVGLEETLADFGNPGQA